MHMLQIIRLKCRQMQKHCTFKLFAKNVDAQLVYVFKNDGKSHGKTNKSE